jgi:hypothetical protein
MARSNDKFKLSKYNVTVISRGRSAKFWNNKLVCARLNLAIWLLLKPLTLATDPNLPSFFFH